MDGFGTSPTGCDLWKGSGTYSYGPSYKAVIYGMIWNDNHQKSPSGWWFGTFQFFFHLLGMS